MLLRIWGVILGLGRWKGFKRIVGAVNDSFSSVENSVILLLENTAGTKNSMGSAFEDLRRIFSEIEVVDRVGVCFDTSHAFAAGTI
jgi:deoxyribonuclease IV